ncbi:Tar ligand binding domain-containing protein [Paraburkholderia graminis]|uniref:Tar ligand binding domain-containing protein n=1 Tax=Paraburkholderia graminis TaxID=60548 RepID=UPI0038B7BB7E
MESFSVRARLTLTKCILCFLLCLAVGFGLYGINALNASAKDVSLNSLPAVNALGFLRRARCAGSIFP